jgi:hypothetical protein
MGYLGYKMLRRIDYELRERIGCGREHLNEYWVY